MIEQISRNRLNLFKLNFSEIRRLIIQNIMSSRKQQTITVVGKQI